MVGLPANVAALLLPAVAPRVPAPAAIAVQARSAPRVTASTNANGRLAAAAVAVAGAAWRRSAQLGHVCRQAAAGADSVATLPPGGTASKPDVVHALYDACRAGNAAVAGGLLRGHSAELRGAAGRPDAVERVTPLAWAVFYGQRDLVEQMLQTHCDGMSPEEADRALAQACRQGNLEIMELLADSFPAVTRTAAGRELFAACRASRGPVARFLVERFPEEARSSLARQDERDASTPFYWACRGGLVGLVRSCLERFPEEVRAAAKLPDRAGRTPLAWACQDGHEGIVKLLLPLFPPEDEMPSPPHHQEVTEAAGAKKMLHEATESVLTKQGYRLVGSHSAVKQCRWTKSGLRGQGQCYKHAFYGIKSHGCMEGTPSLACANKCTFCWRGHANPVATSWVFQTDDPEFIVEESIRAHLELIEEAAKSPLVLPERLEEARVVRHMALSLVGEPVLYPRIAELVAALHRRRISTFLVTNGQFPEQLEALPWVTQLYVSVDAPTEEELREVGRPLFKDHWHRLRRALSALSAKRPRQRTVCRMTVLKPLCQNEASLEGFAELIGLSECDFVEVKGATYSGWQEEDGSGLSRASVPWHEEVCNFAESLAQRLPGYSVACEHEHSCAVLLARRDRFLEPTGHWRTWIDFERFAAATETGETLDVADFTIETPAWALADGWQDAGADTAGFDPAEYRRRRRPSMEEFEKLRKLRHAEEAVR